LLPVKYILPLTVLLTTTGCQRTYTPKPEGYLRIDFPEKTYRLFDSAYPYSFEYPVYAYVVPDTDRFSEPYWVNIDFPRFDGKIHISYKQVRNNLDRFTEDSRTLAYKHSIKADAIKETLYGNDSSHVYGILYEIKGNAASSLQFFVTDSTRNFLRGSLYFNVQPNKDSLAPVISFFRDDIIRLMETVRWKN
jgi:gliding motility-associated lipoprotein GldD